jgi:hypothetical protein
MADESIKIQMTLPWWAGPMLRCLGVAAWLGLPVNADAVGRFLARHARYSVT